MTAALVVVGAVALLLTGWVLGYATGLVLGARRVRRVVDDERELAAATPLPAPHRWDRDGRR